MQNSTAIRECDVDTVRIISIKGISKVGISFLSDLGRPGKSYNKVPTVTRCMSSLSDVKLRVQMFESAQGLFRRSQLRLSKRGDRSSKTL